MTAPDQFGDGTKALVPGLDGYEVEENDLATTGAYTYAKYAGGYDFEGSRYNPEPRTYSQGITTCNGEAASCS